MESERPAAAASSLSRQPQQPQAPPGTGAPPGQIPPGGWQYPVAPPKPVWSGPPLASWGSRVARFCSMAWFSSSWSA